MGIVQLVIALLNSRVVAEDCAPQDASMLYRGAAEIPKFYKALVRVVRSVASWQ